MFATLAENFVLENFELMFIAGYTIPIFGLQNDLYYNERFSSQVDGKSCLLKFCTIHELNKYIQVTDLLFRITDSILFNKSHLVTYLRVCFVRYLGTFKQFIANNKVFNFMNAVKWTLTYWKRLLQRVLAMAKQLRPPKFFLTFSFVDLRWWKMVFWPSYYDLRYIFNL